MFQRLKNITHSAAVATDIFLCVVTSATEIGNLRPSAQQSECVAKIHDVGFYCLTSAAWDDPVSVYDSMPSPTFPEQVDSLRDAYSGQTTPNNAVYEHPCSPLMKIISAGTFYYAVEPHWDLSSRLSHRVRRDPNSAKDVATYDDRFVWNEYMVRSLLDFRERLEPQERDDLDFCQFIVSLLLLGLMRSDSGLSGPYNSRLCRYIHLTVTGTSNEWHSYDCHDIPHIKAGMEKSWHSLQH